MSHLDIVPIDFQPNTTSSSLAPLYPQAIILPAFAFPAWILCMPPLIWQFRQGNIAAGSLLLWVCLVNFFLSINPLIWPRDNISEWWDGHVWCDINVRIHVGASLGTTSSTVMILRKLAKVMDTRNITVSSSRGSKMREMALEIFWCWIYPLIFIILFYVIQAARYILYGIIGCVSAVDTSSLSIFLNFLWPSLTILVAGGYAVLLTYRLYRYRREFVRLVAARNTTKSRFIRLFLLCMVIIVIYLPFTGFLLLTVVRQRLQNSFDWNRVHDPRTFNKVFKVPLNGVVPLDKWVQVSTGYWLFFIFGTGNDAHNLYKQMLLAVGLGKLFPGLYAKSHSGSSNPSSFNAAKSWTINLPSRVKHVFVSRSHSVTEMTDRSRATQTSIASTDVYNLRPIDTEEPILSYNDKVGGQASTEVTPSLLQRIFRRKPNQSSSLLPIFSSRNRSKTVATDTQESLTRIPSRGVSTHAWAVDKDSSSSVDQVDGVVVVKEVHQDREERGASPKQKYPSSAWD